MSVALIPTKEEIDTLQVMAKAAADSRHFEKIGGYAGLFSISLYAREIGIPPMTALHGGLVPVLGKIAMSAEMMNSLIRQKGHRLDILKADALVCTIKGTRKDTGETYTCSFSIDDARKAGLVKGGGGYEKHTDDMLFARCISKLKRRLFPDIATKAYVHGEIEDVDPQDPVIESTSKIMTIDAEVVDVLSYITDQQQEQIIALIGDDADFKRNVFKHFKVKSFTEISGVEFDTILERAKVWSQKMKEISTTKDQELPI